jgi:hypothetical protein
VPAVPPVWSSLSSLGSAESHAVVLNAAAMVMEANRNFVSFNMMETSWSPKERDEK